MGLFTELDEQKIFQLEKTITQQAKEINKLRDSEITLFHALQYMINNSGEPRSLETRDGFARAHEELKRASASLVAHDLIKRNEVIKECAQVTVVYVVLALYDYEGYSIITSFINEDCATKFAEECKEYDLTKEPYPDDDSDEFFDPWLDRDAAWRGAHPAGGNANADDYRALSVDVRYKDDNPKATQD